MSDLCSVRIHRIDHNLHSCCLATVETAREIVRNHKKKIQFQVLHRVFRILGAAVDARHIEIHVLSECVDQITAFDGEALVYNSYSQIANLGVQRVSEDDEHDGRWNHQLNNEAGVASELLEFLRGQRKITPDKSAHITLPKP